MAPASRATMRLELREHTLDNGLRVVLQPDASAPLVAVHVMYHVGSKNERAGRTGFAHLFEHLLFQGSEHVAKEQHFKLVQDAGGTLNGTTWFDRTNYFETLPANELDLGLWLESDRMGFFKPGITQEKLDNQREVVKNERRQSYENRPYGLAFETLLERAYDEGHPYRHPTIGYMPDIDAARLEDVHEFFDLHYGPNNATLVLVGDFDPREALDRVEAWFGEIPARPVAPRPDVPLPVRGGERRALLPDRVQMPRVYLLYHSPRYADPDFEAVVTLNYLLADGNSSRFEKTLVYEEQMAADVTSFTWPTESAGMCFVVATARPGVAAADLETEVRDVIDDLLRGGVEEEEMEGARNRARRGLLNGRAGFGDRADAIAHAAVLRGDAGYVNDAFARYGAVARPDVERVAHTVFDPRGLTVLHVVPEEGADGADAPEETP
ncbi:M16 family metallopeptidase [Candidatus Palauibacter sp.]|uniref:M16 family metallopeptidase n=1 Tax=Candidatus Palauibacter sp. TaxID=3101350 RepID=UPI003B52F852